MYVRRSKFWFKAETCWHFTFLDDSHFLTEICFETNEKANDSIGMEKGGRLSYKVRKDLLQKKYNWALHALSLLYLQQQIYPLFLLQMSQIFFW